VELVSHFTAGGNSLMEQIFKSFSWHGEMVCRRVQPNFYQ